MADLSLPLVNALKTAFSALGAKTSDSNYAVGLFDKTTAEPKGIMGMSDLASVLGVNNIKRTGSPFQLAVNGSYTFEVEGSVCLLVLENQAHTSGETLYYCSRKEIKKLSDGAYNTEIGVSWQSGLGPKITNNDSIAAFISWGLILLH